MSRLRVGLIGMALAVATATTSAGVAFAHPEGETDGGTHAGNKPRDARLHGANTGHLEASSKNVNVLSKLKLRNVVPEKIADVGVFKNHAYLAAWGVVDCKYNGVHVVDIKDVRNPKEVAFIGSKEGSYPGEGIQALTITTPSFNGDVLLSNNEKCNDKTGFGGLNIYDVTRPTSPTPLAEGIGDFTVNGQGKKDANEIHSVFGWDAGDRAYAVIVDNVETTDVDIMDITNPRKPFLVAEYDLAERFPQILQAAPRNLIEVFLHDMVVKQIGGRQVMIASYWDGGYVKLDVTDVKNPTYIGDTDFKNPDPEAAESGLTVAPEGNGHQAEFTADNKYIVAADEDFDPYKLAARNVTAGTDLSASPGDGTPQLTPGQTISGQSRFVGRACTGGTAVPKGNGSQIAVVERGTCSFTEKVGNVAAAGGYSAVLVFNRPGLDGCSTPLRMSVDGTIPAFGVATRQQGFAIFGAPYDDDACRAGTEGDLAPITVGATGATLSFSSSFDGWGYVHLFRNGSGKLTALDTYAVPEAHDPKYAFGFGDLSVHEVATSQKVAKRLYFSYYSAGFRVAEIVNDKIVEKGHYIDPAGSNLWGVDVFQQGTQEYVAVSDRDFGLMILQYAG